MAHRSPLQALCVSSFLGSGGMAVLWHQSVAQDVRGAHLDDTCVGDPRTFPWGLSRAEIHSSKGMSLKRGVVGRVVTCGQGAQLRGDSSFSLLSLPVAHGNAQFGLKCEVLLLSLSSAVPGPRTFLYLQFNVHTDHTSCCI